MHNRTTLSFSIVCSFYKAVSSIPAHSSRSDSGHGGQTKDLDGDEADGYDEGQRTLVSAPGP